MFVRIHHPLCKCKWRPKNKQAKLSNLFLPEHALAKLRVDIAPGGDTDHVSSLQVTNFTSTLPRIVHHHGLNNHLLCNRIL